MLGWLSAEQARDSRWKRSSAWRSPTVSRGRNLKRDIAAPPRILGVENDAQAATTDSFKDSVVGNGFANHIASDVKGGAS
jgi:hypothetical protein